ncbi:isoprenoid synthase domain-containing protein [Hypoxylon cercidicola]|nr:isoprenoid synthase domain-containing protein [Hypoxylon cercidicola]
MIVQFDEGHLKRGVSAAKQETDSTLGIMEETQARFSADDNPIRYVFQSNMGSRQRDFQRRWKEVHLDYFHGLLEQLKAEQTQRTLTRSVHEYLDMRRNTIAVCQAAIVIEHAERIQLSEDIINHPSVQECRRVAVELTLLHNDTLSYKKDVASGVDHNLILVLRSQGYSIHEAMDCVDAMLQDYYKRWYIALANMPIWGEEIDRQVLRYVDIYRNIALGGLHWSFKTSRYLGSEGGHVRQTPMWSVLC